MFELIFTKSYEKKAARFIKSHPELKNQYSKTLQLLELNPFHPSLRLHKFRTSNYEGYSVSINLSYRIAIDFIVSDRKIIPVNIGEHLRVYGRK